MSDQLRTIEEDEIDLIELLKKVWSSKRFIVRWTGYFIVIGLVVALLSPKEFTASSTFIPQTSESKTGGSLSGLASLAGISLGGATTGGEIPPTLYPQILNSVPVKRSILSIEVPLDQTSVTYSAYLLEKPTPILSLVKKYTIGLPGVILGAIRGTEASTETSSNPMIVTQEEKGLFETLEAQIALSVNEKEGFVELSVTTDDATVAAVLTSKVKEILQQQIIDYKIQHGKEYLNFTQKQYNEKQKEYFALQDEVARAKDQNKNIISERYQNQFKQKEGELLIAQSVYQELAKQLEQAKLQVAKDTPIFSTIKPVTIPTERSAPKRSLILVIWAFLGFVVSVGVVLVKEPVLNIWKEINS
ncbi:MAG: Wzz/FepE/Etk N-terminal domain-containing protein [Nitrosopumilaceae archaeon]